MKKYINLFDKTSLNMGGPRGYCRLFLENDDEFTFNYFLTNKSKIYKFRYFLSIYFPIIFKDRSTKLMGTQIFHYTTDLNFFNTRNCSAVLMYHSPAKMSKETANIIKKKLAGWKYFLFCFYILFFHWWLSIFINLNTQKAFNNAQKIIFPSMGAMQNTKKHYTIDDKKVIFIPTIIRKKQYLNSDKFNTSPQKISIIYIGRADSEKGFFNFVKLTKNTSNDLVEFINVGNNKKVKNARNLGFINYVDEVLHKGDYLFTYPKLSYYDLICLEGKVAGINFIGNSVGGNNEILDKNEKFNSLSEVIKFVNNLKQKPKRKNIVEYNINNFILSWKSV